MSSAKQVILDDDVVRDIDMSISDYMTQIPSLFSEFQARGIHVWATADKYVSHQDRFLH